MGSIPSSPTKNSREIMKIILDIVLRMDYNLHMKMKGNTMQVRSGSLSYLTQVHKQLGIWKYSMKVLRKWSDGKYTVLFEIGRAHV